MTAKVACDLLTGFLGSGKTTLLNAFLREKGTGGVAVVVNEFGAIGLDQLVFQEVADNVLLLESGCLCCTISGSLRETLLQLEASVKHSGTDTLRHVVIETTGLANPLPVLNTLLGDPMLMQTFELGRVITTVDGVAGQAQLRLHPESVQQASLADVLVITKADLADEPSLRALRTQLEHLNPHAQIMVSDPGHTGVEALDLSMRESELSAARLTQTYVGRLARAQALGEAVEVHSHGHDHDDHHHDGHGIGSWSAFTTIQPTWAGVSAWWNLIVHQYGARLLRCKGLLRLDDVRPFVLIQGVGTVFHSPVYLDRWPDDDPRSRLVCIGFELDPAWLSESLRALRIVEPAGQPLTLAEIEDCL